MSSLVPPPKPDNNAAFEVPQLQATKRRELKLVSRRKDLWRWPVVITSLCLLGTMAPSALVKLDSHWQFFSHTLRKYQSHTPRPITIPPLVMSEGDPYLRALMRTISASESNTAQPYHVIFGGQHVTDLSEHPNHCVTIPMGPNRGKCSTAAGRYQFLNTTWAEKATLYHPEPQQFLLWKHYSFEPHYQDQVVYRWLNDSRAWGGDLKQLLAAGQINKVLKRLSPTWTSLGYGIEDNVMSDRLPQLYQQLLAEELSQAAPK